MSPDLRVEPRRHPFHHVRLPVVSLLLVLFGAGIMTAVILNLKAMEENRIEEYHVLARRIAQASTGFVNLKQYDHLLDFMKMLTDASSIRYMALEVDGTTALQSGVPPAGRAQRFLGEQQKLPGGILLRLPLKIPGEQEAQAIILELFFTLQDFQARQNSIFTSIGIIAALLAVLLLLLRLLDQTRSRLLEEENTKSQMIRAISHHSMQFITAIYGKLFHLLEQKSGPRDPGLEKDLKIIRENTDALRRSLENLKDNERLSKGGVKSLSQRLHLRNLIQTGIASFEIAAGKKKLTLTVSLPEGDLEAWADQEIVRTVLMNLLDNAVKFSPLEGKIAIVAEASGDLWEIRVQDQGPGLAPGDFEKIFTPFVRLLPKVEGTGLGLSNSRKLIALTGGSLGIRASQPGGGTTFYFTIPARPGLHAAEGKPS